MAGTFSQQRGINPNAISGGSFSKQTQQNQQTAPTRTERVKAQQEQKNFENLKASADVVDDVLWKDIVTTEKENYSYEIPRVYIGRESEWFNLRESKRNHLLWSYKNDHHYTGGVVTISGARDVTKTRQFTNEDYGSWFEKLDPKLRQFFMSRDQLEGKQQEFRVGERVKTQTKIETARQQLANYELSINEQRDKYERWFRDLSSEKRARNRDRYEERMEEYDNDLDEKRSYYNGFIEKLGWGVGELDAGKMIEAQAIEQYADRYGGYKEDRERARNEKRKYDNAQAEKGLTPVYSSGGSISGWIDKNKTPLPDYLSGKAKLTDSDIGYYNQIANWSKNKGFDKLPSFAQNVLNPSAMQFQSKNPTEKLVFNNSGGVVGVESGAFQQSMTTGAYNTKVTNAQVEYNNKLNEYKNNKVIDLPFKLVDDPAKMYGNYKGTTNTMDNGKKLVRTDIKDVTQQSSFFSDVMGGVGKGFNWLTERARYTGKFDYSKSYNPFTVFGTIEYGKSDKKSDPQLAMEYYSGKLDERINKLDVETIGQDKIDAMKTGLDQKYQSQYQKAFEEKYFVDVAEGKIKEEDALTQFAETDEAKAIDQQYSTEYQDKYKDLQKDVGFFAGWKSGAKQTGLSLTKLGLNIASNPVKVGTTAGVIAGAGYTLSALPTSANVGINAVLGVDGTIKALNKDLTYQERVAGSITAGVSALSLGYTGYKYLKSPVVSYEKIPSVRNYKTTGSIGNDMKIIGKDGKMVDAVIFNQQKLSQVGVAGRRTIITTKWRDLLNKYVTFRGGYKLNLKPSILSANPKPAQYTKVYEFLQKPYRVLARASERTNAQKYLMKYGYTKSQASRVMRYYAPRVVETWQRGQLFVKNGKAVGEFYNEIRQPIIKVNGVNTRGSRTIQERVKLNRVAMKVEDNNFILEYKNVVGKSVDKYGNAKQLTNVGQSVDGGMVKVGEIEKGYQFQRVGNNVAYKEAEYRELFGGSKKIVSSSYAPAKNIQISIERMDQPTKFGRTYLINRGEVDLTRTERVANIIKGSKKTPWSKTFAEEYAKTNAVTNPASNKPINEIAVKELQELKQINNMLSTAPTPTIEKVTTKMDKLSPIVRETNILETSLFTGLSTKNMLSTNLKSANSLKEQLKLNTLLKQNLIVDTQLKMDTIVKTKLKQNLVAKQTPFVDIGFIVSPLNPKIPVVAPPKIPFKFKMPLIFGNNNDLKKKIKSKQKKTPSIFGLMPDFTARSIDLKPQQFGSVKDALKEINRVKTGFEVSRGGQFAGGRGGKKISTGFSTPKKFFIRGANVKKVGQMDINLKGIMA